MDSIFQHYHRVLTLSLCCQNCRSRRLLDFRNTLSHFAKLILLLSLSNNVAGSQNFTDGFNFHLPPTDTASTRFIPSFLSMQLTDQDFVSIDREGHFSVRGKPLRFFGTNLVADGAFPTKSKAWFIAGRLRKMGFNVVRFHFLDNPWSAASLFEQGWTTRQLNPATLDRLDNILAELKRNGVYADINLHVGRTFTKLDGLPDTDSLQDFCKAINYFDPAVLALHKEFARQLLTHRNPYTGTSLVNDPVMAVVEITNENSLYRYWRDGKLKPIAEGGILTFRHTKMLDSAWVSFLQSRYANSTLFADAWNFGSYDGGVNQLVNGTFESYPPSTGWVLEVHPPATGTVSRDSLIHNFGRYSAKVIVSQVDGTDWHLQWKQIGISLTKDTSYAISFAARADSTRSISVSLMKDVSPWTWYGGMTILLTPQWRTFSLTVRAPETVNGVARLSFTVGAQIGTFWFDDLVLAVSGVKGLLAGESLESSSVRRIDYAESPGFTNQRVRDMSLFYIKLQDDYFAQVHSFLRDTLNVRVPIVGTNWNIGPADMAVQSKLDYIDNHAYWDHPSFPRVPWSPTDWYIANTPMVQDLNGGTIAALMAAVPMKGKPYTISEYNHPFPNRYQSEALLFLTGYASFHDADGLMLFDYNGSVDDWENDQVASYFNIYCNSAMMCLIPSCALAYRTGMISKAEQTLLINYAPDDYLTLPRRDNTGWMGPSLISQKLALKYAVRTGSFASAAPFDPASLPSAPTRPYITDTKEIIWDTNGLLSVVTGNFVGTTGMLNNFPGQSHGPMKVKAANGFGTITWVSLTQDSVQRAPLSLLTISTKVQNTGMVWDGTTTIHNNWGGSPTQVAPLIASLQLAVQADSLRIYPLDPYGRETKGYATYKAITPNTFDVVIDQSQSRSLWFGIEKFGNGVTVSVSSEPGKGPDEFRLEQNYPNPFNPSTQITYQLPRTSHVRLAVFDVLGREIATLVNGVEEPGHKSVQWDASGVASGVYLYRIQVRGSESPPASIDALGRAGASPRDSKSGAGTFVQTKKLIMLR